MVYHPAAGGDAHHPIVNYVGLQYFDGEIKGIGNGTIVFTSSGFYGPETGAVTEWVSDLASGTWWFQAVEIEGIIRGQRACGCPHPPGPEVSKNTLFIVSILSFYNLYMKEDKCILMTRNDTPMCECEMIANSSVYASYSFAPLEILNGSKKQVRAEEDNEKRQKTNARLYRAEFTETRSSLEMLVEHVFMKCCNRH